MSTNPLVSILIPAFNAEQWIRQAIESALAQTYPNKEVIVVDDGSTDSTQSIIKSFGDRIRFIHSAHMGGNAARNLLLEMSSGEWLQYLDADDYLLPGKIASQIEELHKNRDAFDVICSPFILRNEANNEEITVQLDSPLDVAAEYIRWGPLWTGGFLIRRAALVEVGGWKEDQVACQEHELLLRFIHAEKRFGLANKAEAVYRQHGSGTVSKKDPLRTIRLRLELTDSFERFLYKTDQLRPVYSRLLYRSRLECARTAWAYDQLYASELAEKASATGRWWISGSKALPARFQAVCFLFGFRRAQQFASALRGREGRLPVSTGDFAQEQPMHVLLINQFFWPDGAPTGLLLEDVARELAQGGCKITVICSHGSYHEPRHDEAPPVRILKVPGLPYSRTRIGRMLSWITFLAWASLRSLFIGRVDVVLTMTSPPGLSAIGAMLKKIRGTRFWIWEMDLYPDVAAALGASNLNARAGRLVANLMHSFRKQADGIIAIGPCMRDRLLAHGLDPRQIVVAENWSDSRIIRAFELPDSDQLRILYSGNLGLAHETETIGNVILKLRDAKHVQFTFAGGGSRRREIKALCDENKISSVNFEPYVDRQSLSKRLASCHVGLVTLRHGCQGTLVPSKVYSFLAAGRPILYIGPDDSTLARIVQEGAGWHCEPGDVEGIIALIERLAEDRQLVHLAAAHSRRLFEERYDKPEGVARVVDLLLSAMMREERAASRIESGTPEISESDLLRDIAPK